MEWSISARAWRPRSLFPASRSQMPAPKSTPPAVLYAVMARRSTKAIPSGIGVEPPWPRSVRHPDLGRRPFAGVVTTPARAEPQEQRHVEEGDQGVDDHRAASIDHTNDAGALVTASETRIVP